MKSAIAEALQLGASQLDGASDLLSIDEIEAGRNKLLFAIQNVKRDYIINWHHSQLAEALEKVQCGEITRLMVFMPPQHGKSEQVSRHFPAWCLGKEPDEKIIACSYGASLASDMGRDVQNIMKTDEYQAMFATRLKSGVAPKKGSAKAKETNLQFDVINGTGHYIGAGVGGGIGGKPFSLGIIDDYFKNREEAESVTRRNTVGNWYTSTFYPRRMGKLSPCGCDRIIVCTTLWHDNGLAGRILAEAKLSGEVWYVIRFPAIAEDEDADIYTSSSCFEDPRRPGEALWPFKHDVEDLRTNSSMSSRDWVSLYQCRPSVAKGNIFQRDWWKYYDKLPKDHLIYSFDLDCAFDKGQDSSFVVLQLWASKGVDEYLVDQWRARRDYRETKALCRSKFAEWPKAHTKRIEKKANGAAIINELRDEFPGLVAIEPKGSKQARALAVQGRVEAGNVHLPRHADWVPGYIDEHAAFPHGANDDQVDCTTQHLEHGAGSSMNFLRAMTDWMG